MEGLDVSSLGADLVNQTPPSEERAKKRIEALSNDLRLLVSKAV